MKIIIVKQHMFAIDELGREFLKPEFAKSLGVSIGDMLVVSE